MDLSGLTKKLSRSIDQGKQYAMERMGVASELTPYPPEYRVLEEETDRKKTLYDNLIRIHRQLMNAHLYDPPIQEQMANAIGRINEKLGSGMCSKGTVAINHAVAKVALENSSSNSEGIQDALTRYGAAMRKVGDSQIQMNARISERFVKPMVGIVETIFGNAIQGRKQASKARLELDTIKGKFRNAKPEKCEALEKEMVRVEGQFRQGVEEAVERMRAIVENPMIMQCLSDLVEAQRAYHQEAHAILSSLVVGNKDGQVPS